MKNEVWAILPARGGSKGIKSKNSKILGKIPLIAHTIKTLKKSKCFSKIIVTSDDHKILNIAKKYNVMIHKRINPVHSNDFSMPDLTTCEVLECIKKSTWPKFIFMTACTSPFTKYTTFIKALKILRKHPHGTVFAAHESNFFLWKENKKNKKKVNFLPIAHPFKKRLGRQFMDKQVNETGAFYAFDTSNFMKAKHRYFSEAFPCLVSGAEIIDINDMNDWNHCEYIIDKNEN
ncbi:acylneuraminate cytidylyltransferase family protein [Candidatus Pelagibacter sp.]|nr:acylneuraminate cytidylyltransferase family protein [Candidatus Pelagibacter sp.]